MERQSAIASMPRDIFEAKFGPEDQQVDSPVGRRNSITTIAESIFEVPGQRTGEALGESSAK